VAMIYINLRPLFQFPFCCAVKATLDEILKLLQNHFIRNGIQPNPPVHMEDIVIESAKGDNDSIIDFRA